MNKRGVYFFVIDAFIGGAIILLGMIMVLNAYTSSPMTNQPLIILEDLVAYFQNTQVRDFQGNYTQTLLENGTIKNKRATLFEQVAYFHYQNNLTKAENLIGEVANSSLPDQFSLRYYYDNDLLYDESNFPYDEAGVALASRKIAMVSVNSTEVYGPHIVEVILWTS